MIALKSHMILFLILIAIALRAQEKQFQDSLNKAELLVYENPEEAIELANSLQAKINRKDAPQKISILLLLGSAHSSKQQHQKALEYAFEAYELAKKSEDFIDELKVLGFISNQYYILQLDEKVDFYLDQSEKIISQHAIPDSIDYIVANTYFIRALNYKDKLDCNFAINYFNKAITIYQNSDYSNSKINLPITYIQKAYCFLDQHELDSAEYNFKKAYDISLKNKITYSQSHAKIGISKILFEKKDFNAAIDTLKKVEKELETSSPLSLKSDIYSNLSDNYLQIQDFENYKKYTDFYLKVKKESDASEVKFAGNILDSQLSESDKNFKIKERNVLISGIIILISLLGLIFFVKFKTKRS